MLTLKKFQKAVDAFNKASTERKNILRKYCVQCEGLFCAGDMMFYTDHGYGMFLCQTCAEKEKPMPNIKITAEVNGKQVPLETVSTETFEAIKALEKPKEIPVPVARVGHYHGNPNDRRLFLKITDSIRNRVVDNDIEIIAINLVDGLVQNSWVKNDARCLSDLYVNIKPL